MKPYKILDTHVDLENISSVNGPEVELSFINSSEGCLRLVRFSVQPLVGREPTNFVLMAVGEDQFFTDPETGEWDKTGKEHYSPWSERCNLRSFICHTPSYKKAVKLVDDLKEAWSGEKVERGELPAVVWPEPVKGRLWYEAEIINNCTEEEVEALRKMPFSVISGFKTEIPMTEHSYPPEYLNKESLEIIRSVWSKCRGLSKDSRFASDRRLLNPLAGGS